MWFKSCKVQDSDNHFNETEVLYRVNFDEEGVPIVFTEAYVEKYNYWYSEITSFTTVKSACSFIKTVSHVHAVDWIDRIIEESGLPEG